MAVAIATYGAGGAALGALTTLASESTVGLMASAALTSLATNTTLNLINNQGNPSKALAALVQKEQLRSLVTSIAAAGVLDGLGLSGQPAEFSGHLAKAATNTVSSMAVSLSFGKKVNLKEGFIATVVDAGGASVANQLKMLRAYLGYIGHKLGHASLGAMMGAILSKDRKSGAISGAVGGVSAEIIGEAITPPDLQQRMLEEARLQGRPFEEAMKSYQQEVRFSADMARLASGSIALFAKQDASIAINTATNAVENNLLLETTLALWELREKVLDKALNVAQDVIDSHERFENFSSLSREEFQHFRMAEMRQKGKLTSDNLIRAKRDIYKHYEHIQMQKSTGTTGLVMGAISLPSLARSVVGMGRNLLNGNTARALVTEGTTLLNRGKAFFNLGKQTTPSVRPPPSQTAQNLGQGVGVGTGKNPPTLVPSSAPKTPQVRLNYQSGRNFQNLVHEHLIIPENNTVYSVIVRGKGTMTTRPDLPLPLAGVTDIKNVQYITFTKQLQTQAALAKQGETSFNLIISPSTEKISKNVWNEIFRSGGKIFEFSPTTETMIERVVDGNKVLR